MRGKRRFLILVMALVSLTTANSLSAPDSHPLAPALSFITLSGEKVQLDQFKGSVVLLNLWTTSCSICLSEIPTLSALQTQYASQGLRVVGVALDDQVETVHRFTEKHPLGYTVLVGTREVQEQLGAEAFPVTFLIGRDGRIYSQHSGAVKRGALESEITQLLAADSANAEDHFHPSEGSEPVQIPTAAELKSDVPGVDLSKLSTAQVTALKQQLDETACPCSCNRTVLKCLSNHSSCKDSKRFAHEVVENLQRPMI
jgi:peroxiredoxin